MGIERNAGGAPPPLVCGNIFVGHRDTWQTTSSAIREQCEWYEQPPINWKKASLILFDGTHPDCINFLEQCCLPVIVLCGHGNPHLETQFREAGAVDVLCGMTQVDQIVSILRVTERLNGRFNRTVAQTERKQTKTLLETAQSIVASHDINQLLVQIADSIIEVVDATHVLVIRIDTKTRQILDTMANAEWPQDELSTYTYMELEEGLSGEAWRTKETVISSGTVLDAREKPHIQQSRSKSGVGALIVSPLMYDEDVIGTLTVIRLSGEPDFTQAEVDIVTTMVQMGAVAIKNAQLSQNAQQSLDQTQILLNVAAALVAAESPAALLERVLKEVISGLNATGGMYIHYDVGKQQIVSAERFVEKNSRIETQLVSDYRFFMEGLTGCTIRSKRPVLSNEQIDERQSEAVYQYRVAENTGGVIVAPIIHGGTVLGTISVHRLLGEEAFTERELGILTAVANQIASALIHVRSFEDTKLRVDILAKRLEQRNRDLEQRNNELRRANKQLQQVDKLKDKFINEVSHELRRPVTVFRLYLSMLEKRPKNANRYLSTLNKATDQFEELIIAILDLARLHVVDTRVQGKPLDFIHVIDRSVSLYQPIFEENEVRFTQNLGLLPNIVGVSDLLEKMCNVLLKNALSYTDQGYVTISSGHEIETVWFEVADSGIGIAEDEIPLIHRRFYRSEQVKQKRPGIGLGLSIAHEIVKLHGGMLDVTSILGEGSTFRVTLPKKP